MNKELMQAFKTILNNSENKAHCWIEWLRPMIGSMLEISEEEVEKRYYTEFFN